MHSQIQAPLENLILEIQIIKFFTKGAGNISLWVKHQLKSYVLKKFFQTCLIVILSFSFSSAFAAPNGNVLKKKKNHYVYDITKSPKYSSLVVNADTGEVLYKKDASKRLHPASLTKMMTLYLTFQALEQGKLKINQELDVSHHAASQPKTKLFLRPNTTITVRDAIYGLIIHSANDAAVVLAEAISGTEDAFSYKMTDTAQKLGMRNTNFVNAHGLHHPQQVTTAFDMAKLGIALRRDYPKYYPMFSKRSFMFKGNVIASHNRVLQRYKWADGLKTGFINASGFNVVSSATRPEGRVIAVVMGGPTAKARDDHMISLLEKSYYKLASSKGLNLSNQVAKASLDSDLEPNSTTANYEEDAFSVAETSESEQGSGAQGDKASESTSAFSALEETKDTITAQEKKHIIKKTSLKKSSPAKIKVKKAVKSATKKAKAKR